VGKNIEQIYEEGLIIQNYQAFFTTILTLLD
jgi:hypothetical protein